MFGGMKWCPGPASRRSFLSLGAAALGGLALSDVLRLRAEAKAAVAPDTSVIFVWLPGGPPHMEMYDLKPEAPSEYRGAFSPIHTNVAGIDVSEHLPLHAKCADKYTLIRSISHDFADHGGGHKRFMTGRIPATPVDTVNDAPAVPTIVAKCRENVTRGVPNYICGADGGREGVDVFAFGSAYLGPSYTAFTVPGDPSSDKFGVRNLSLDESLETRLDDRVALMKSLDRMQRRLDQSGTMGALDTFNQRAVDLLMSDKARKAFDLSAEDQRVRDRYGRHAYGQRALMARRLVEAGASWVTMVMENPMPGQALPDGVCYNWDSHAVNCDLYKDSLCRFPLYDQAVTALVEDIYERGLDKRVLLVVTGEFGRTPRISYAKDRPGRDHWPSAMSLLVSGGGLKMGQVVGSTNAKGEMPKERPLTPNDLWATVYRHLGIDYERSFPDYSGRPNPILPFGAPIDELYG